MDHTNAVVQDAYDRIAGSYAAQRDQFRNQKYLERFAALLPAGQPVLDIGCGAGMPVDLFLTERGFAVHGLDLSAGMIELARTNVPTATYEVRDMTSLRAGEYAAGGIVSLYAIFHTPRSGHQALLDTFASFLPEGGALLISMGSGEWEGYEEDFHGARMFWSHYGPEQNARMVEQAGFQIVLDEIDHSGGEQHQFIVAQKMQP